MNVSTALRPSYILQSILQLSTVTIKGEKIIKHNSGSRLCKFVVFLALCFNLWLNQQGLNAVRSGSIFTDMVFACAYYGDVLMLSCVVFHSSRYADLEVALWEQSFQLEKDLRRLNITINPLRVTWCAVFYIFINLVLIAQLLYGMIDTYSSRPFLVFLCDSWYLINILYRTCLESVFTSWIFLIQIIFKKCNQEEISLEVLEKIYQTLDELIQKVVKLYSASVLINLYYNFVLVVHNSFYIIRTIYSGRKVTKTHSIYGLFLRIADAGLYAVICHQWWKNANAMKRRLWEKAHENEKEAFAFGLQLLHHDYAITAAGWFPINLSMIFAAVASVTMCLLMLIQLDLQNKEV